LETHDSWSSERRGRHILYWWQEKTRYFRKLAKGWRSNIEANIREHKKSLMEEYDILDIEVEYTALSLGWGRFLGN
jgi:hypothetical protein